MIDLEKHIMYLIGNIFLPNDMKTKVYPCILIIECDY